MNYWWLTIGIIVVVFIVIACLFYFLYKEGQATIRGERKVSERRLLVNNTISFMLVIVSLGLLLLSWNVQGTASSMLNGLSSFLLTVGFAAVVYYSQAIDSMSKTAVGSSKTDNTKKLTETDLNSLREEIKKELLADIMNEINQEYKSKRSTDNGTGHQ